MSKKTIKNCANLFAVLTTMLCVSLKKVDMLLSENGNVQTVLIKKALLSQLQTKKCICCVRAKYVFKIISVCDKIDYKNKISCIDKRNLVLKVFILVLRELL